MVKIVEGDGDVDLLLGTCSQSSDRLSDLSTSQ